MLSSALKKAVELDIIHRNVAKLAQLPKQHRKEMDVLSQIETLSFMEALNDELHGTLFAFALTTGMRPQEYCGLQWKDIDFERGTATVQRAVIWHGTGGKWHFAQPKTPKSRRTIPLPAAVITDLRKHRFAQNTLRLQRGSLWANHDLVFPSEVGTPLDISNLNRHFKGVLRKAEIRTSIRLYDLRHTTATLLLQAGVNPKVVSERLGHAGITLTLDVYSHVLPNMQQDATEQLERMIFKNKAHR